MSKDLARFLTDYHIDGRRVVNIDLAEEEHSPFIIIRKGGNVAIVNPIDTGAACDYLDVDIHAFRDGQDATAGVFAMSEGRRFTLEETGTKSAGWPSASMVVLLIGEQSES